MYVCMYVCMYVVDTCLIYWMFLPDVAYSLPAAFTSPITPALLALYGDIPALPCSEISCEVPV